MLLQTNSYIVPKEKRTEHARLLQRFRQLMSRLGCDHFEVFEQVGANWASNETGRFVQILRFRDRQHWLAVQAAEKQDPTAGQLIQEFCELVNIPYQQQSGMFVAGYYNNIVPAIAPGAVARPATRRMPPTPVRPQPPAAVPTPAPVETEPQEPQAQPATDQPAPASDVFDIDPIADSVEVEKPENVHNDAKNGDIDVLDYLDEIEPAPASGEDPKANRLD